MGESSRAEEPIPGNTFGSLSNLVTEMTAVVWTGNEYGLRTYQRSDSDITALLTNLGRTFVTSVTM